MRGIRGGWRGGGGGVGACSKGPEPGQLQRGRGVYMLFFFQSFLSFLWLKKWGQLTSYGWLTKKDWIPTWLAAARTRPHGARILPSPEMITFMGILMNNGGQASILSCGKVQCTTEPGMNQPLVSIHHVFSPALLSPLSLNQDHPGPGEDTMESPISLDAAALMYLCKRIRWNQRGLLEVFEMHKDGN